MHMDPIVNEIRNIRKTYAQQFAFNIQMMSEDLKKKEQAHPDRLVSYAPRPVRRIKTA
jgi:hypothetical protein